MPAPGDDKAKRALRAAPKTGDVVDRRSQMTRRDQELDEGPLAEDIERFSDPTKICPECKKEVFDDTEICYHCGHAFSAQDAKKTNVVALVVIVLLLLAFAFAGLRWIF